MHFLNFPKFGYNNNRWTTPAKQLTLLHTLPIHLAYYLSTVLSSLTHIDHEKWDLTSHAHARTHKLDNTLWSMPHAGLYIYYIGAG